MPNGTLPDAGPSVRPADLELAGAWLARHGLVEARPTPLLAMRLAARRRARSAGLALLAVLVIGAALTLGYDRLSTGRFGGFEPHSRTPLVVLAALVVGLVLAQARLDRWVRRVDRRAAATLSRRVSYPVPLGWRAVPGRSFAVCAVAVFAGATMLAVSALTVPDSTVRYGAVILLIGLFGVAAGIVVQLRDVLARPVVAEDEDSLTADIIMRVEDARERSAPVAVWSMPTVLLFGDELGWWNVASLVLALGAAVALSLVHARSAPAVAVARDAMST
jgi:hypothetical protein